MIHHGHDTGHVEEMTKRPFLRPRMGTNGETRRAQLRRAICQQIFIDLAQRHERFYGS